MENRQYQTDIQTDVRQAMLDGHKSILVQLCTGGGKTHLASDMIHTALGKGKRSHFAVHRKILLKQTAETFNAHEIPHGYIAADFDFNPYAKTHICSIDTLYSRLGQFTVPDLLWVDECHMANSPTWSLVIEHYRRHGAWVIGLSATPIRTDGTGLKKHFSHMVMGPAMRWLIDRGFLSDFRMFSPSVLNLKGIATRMGDLAKDQLASFMEGNSQVIGDAVKHYKREAQDTLNITYCVSRKHSEMTAEKFRAEGVAAVHIDGLTTPHDRRAIITAFARREIKVLTNVDLITTGFDLAAQVGRDVNVESISLLRPTKSLSLYLQMVGRGLRRKPKPAIILDHANCRDAFGLPDDEYAWSLADRVIKKKSDSQSSVMVRHCPDCYHDHRPAPACPNCGKVYDIQYREVDERDGELKEIDRTTQKIQTEIGAESIEMQYRTGKFTSKDMDYLVRMGRKKGYKNPEKWAAYIITSRLAKKGKT